MAPGSNPKHTNYTFFNLNYWDCNEKRKKINKKSLDGPILKKKNCSLCSTITGPVNWSLSALFGLFQCEQIVNFLKVQGNTFYYQSSPNDLLLFGPFWSVSLFMKKLLWLLLGQQLENLGYFKFLHLVTLVYSPTSPKTVSYCWNVSSESAKRLAQQITRQRVVATFILDVNTKIGPRNKTV